MLLDGGMEIPDVAIGTFDERCVEIVEVVCCWSDVELLADVVREVNAEADGSSSV